MRRYSCAGDNMNEHAYLNTHTSCKSTKLNGSAIKKKMYNSFCNETKEKKMADWTMNDKMVQGFTEIL